MFKKNKKESKELGQRTSQHRSRSTRQAQFETQKRIKEKAIKGRERGAKQSSQPKAKTRPEHTQIAFLDFGSIKGKTGSNQLRLRMRGKTGSNQLRLRMRFLAVLRDLYDWFCG
ncbi:hypothetical protein YC2023_104052 [Brassica napus]